MAVVATMYVNSRHAAPLCRSWLLAGRRLFSASAPASGLRVLFFGSDDFADRVLRALEEDRTGTHPYIDHLEVVCPKSNYKMKGTKKIMLYQSPVEKLAIKKGLIAHHPFGSSLSNWMIPLFDGGRTHGSFDIGIVASFGHFLPGRIIRGFPRGMINVHPSLLPKYRGPSPIQTTMLNGDKTTGLTIQEVHPTVIDGGKILAQAPYPIAENSPYGQLVSEMGDLGGELTMKVLRDLSRVRELSVEQDGSQATHTRFFRREDAHIVWEEMTAEDIFRVHRTFYEKEPVHTCMRIKNKVKWVQFLELSVAPQSIAPLNADFASFPPGSVFWAKKVPYVEIACLGGSRIHATRFRVSGKAERDTFQFISGYVKGWKDMRMITRPIQTKHLTPPFAYPEGYTRPTSFTDAYGEGASRSDYCAKLAARRTDKDPGYGLGDDGLEKKHYHKFSKDNSKKESDDD
ncbi:Methionyl-tRNA formyltransferase [Coemansia thaxteri]|uniref:methionyl-tRNA formyltransferase n=1 Tax=Coemansia thaxteri TaxID=2663907 RepID=A0A9W8BEB7_9FUNG|nr:Methionyl-tRNA formyltransferase [Coemansia thaxteri]KAJ2005939.1 Methionyl-tRNA formyltransferase [Coemansia thaxteri]KAJ2470166.1 Methionyl-tRNA formyltransferase [Coemansia sp. RSA 2322]KAJ2484122.1 Methionyl-tRNA formyltransferase [Coemansia sp. RSA 2320]